MEGSSLSFFTIGRSNLGIRPPLFLSSLTAQLLKTYPSLLAISIAHLCLNSQKNALLYQAIPYFLAISALTSSIIISVGSELGQTSTQFVHRKQLSKISFAVLSRGSFPFSYAPRRSIKPLGLVTSSGLTLCMVQTGIHFPHFIQSSLILV